MPGKANASKKKSQQLKRNSKGKIDNEELELSEKQIRNTGKRNKNHPKHLSSEAGQIKHTNLKQIKIASNKRRTWQSLSKSTREHLQTMIESVIIAILSNNIKEKEQVQYHLNYLKIRLLQLCETMKVPPKKLKYLTNVSNLLKMEKAQDRANEEGLALLQEEIDKIVETTKSMTGNIQRLKNKVQIVAQEVEEEEEKVKQMLQMDCRGVLSLPELSQNSLRAPTLQVFGAVMHINRGNPFQKEVVLDSWPDFKAVITRRQREAETDNLDHYTNAYAVFYKDVRAYQQLLEEHDVINWDQVFQIQGLQSELYDASKAVANSKQLDIKLTSFKAVHFSPVLSLPDTSFLTGSSPRLTYLSVADADLLNRTWSRGGNEQCLRYIAKLISCFPSVCVRDDRGNPVSWSITDQFATMCHGYTLPEHRRKGYSRLVAITLARKLQSRGFPSQGNVLDDNMASISLLKSVHAEFLPCRFHRLILTPTSFSGQAHL